MAIKAGVVVSYRIVFGSRVIGRGLVIDPLKFGFVIELHDSEPHADPWQKKLLDSPGNATGDRPNPEP